jgi:site-specific DNA recombinase
MARQTTGSKQRHAFMGLLSCARCGCAMTAEKKKGKYVYYRCPGFHGACGNTYIREERLADLLGTVIERIQTPAEIADWIAENLHESQHAVEQTRKASVVRLTQHRHATQSKLDRGYDDYLEGRLSESLWMRKSADWESELATIDRELGRLSYSTPAYVATGENILELGSASKLEIGGSDGTRTRGLRRDRPAF